jgi:hypothetical protein
MPELPRAVLLASRQYWTLRESPSPGRESPKLVRRSPELMTRPGRFHFAAPRPSAKTEPRAHRPHRPLRRRRVPLLRPPRGGLTGAASASSFPPWLPAGSPYGALSPGVQALCQITGPPVGTVRSIRQSRSHRPTRSRFALPAWTRPRHRHRLRRRAPRRSRRASCLPSRHPAPQVQS